MVEFSLVVPILVAVTIGTIDAGKMVVAKQMCAYAAIIGARTGVAKATASSAVVQTAAIEAAPLLHLTAGNVTVAVTVGSTTDVRTLCANARRHRHRDGHVRVHAGNPGPEQVGHQEPTR